MLAGKFFFKILTVENAHESLFQAFCQVSYEGLITGKHLAESRAHISFVQRGVSL